MPKPGKRDWAKDIPVMRIGLLGGENDADRLARVDGYKKLMETTFEVPVKLLVAADYAGVIQAFAAKQLENAYIVRPPMPPLGWRATAMSCRWWSRRNRTAAIPMYR